jgi:hypothetical protein
MNRTRAWMLALAVGCAGLGLGAAPATPSYFGVEQAIARIRAEWSKPGAQPDPNVAGRWNAFFETLTSSLNAYSAARTEDDRLAALVRLHGSWSDLQSLTWQPAVELREALRDWLRPRVALAWAVRRIVAAVQGLPATPDAAVQANRQGWVRFVDDELGKALRDYEGAPNVSARLKALGRINAALLRLEQRNRAFAWTPAKALETAVLELYDRPNVNALADLPTLSRRLANDVAVTGPIYRQGLWSYVTAGRKTGFGLLSSDDGLAFYNSQLMTSVTPITNFYQQMLQDPKGRRAAKMYQFGATSYDASEMTVTAVLRPSGLQLSPASTHTTNATITSVPAPGGGFNRFVAGLLGFNQAKITQKVWEGAIGEIRQGVVTGAAAESKERVGLAQNEQNARLAAYLIGHDTLVYDNIEVRNLLLRSRPQYGLIDGVLMWKGAALQVGADLPKPPTLGVPQAGVTTDVHLGSLMTNLTRGYLQSSSFKDLKNLMVVTQKIPPGGRPRDAIVTKRNVDYTTFLKAIETAEAANDPRILAVRIQWPGELPQFAADRNGYLVALAHGFSIEVPAPPQARRGGLSGPPARIYRLEAPSAEFSISFRIEAAKEELPIRLQGRLEAFDPGPGVKVFALNEDEDKPTQLNAFVANLVLAVFGNKLKGQPIDVPLSNLAIPGFTLSKVSPLDPSGWIRVVLTPNENSPPPATNTRPAPARTAQR